jgi:parallel beta-helix repeat protein
MTKILNLASRAGLLALAMGITSISAVTAPPVMFHVSTKGSDRWSGKLPAPNGKGTDGPFLTLTGARDAVRELKKTQGGALKQPVTIYVHGGKYLLSEPLRFAAEDSGTANCPVTYAAFQSEDPLLSGGRTIRGWKEVKVDGKHLWAAEVPGVREGKWSFRELWIDGQRRTLARSPNTGFYRISNVPGVAVQAGDNMGQDKFEYKPGEIQHYQNFEDVDLVFLTFWISQRRGIASLDETRHIATLTERSRMRLTDGYSRPPQWARYYVENAFELLDSPGEWYLNRKTGVLYYMPLAGERIEKIEAIAPVLPQLMIVEGDPQHNKPVEYLVFRGLTFEHSEWWPPQHPDQGPAWSHEMQAATTVPGAIQLTGARHCSFEKCTVAHVGSYGIHFSRGCDHDRLAASQLFDLGAGGAKIGEPDRIGNLRPGMRSPFPDDPKLETHDIEISDSTIREGGRVFHHGIGVWIGQSYSNLISHNDIHDLYQVGISVGWTWGYGKSLAHDNVIEYNHIYQIGQHWSSDLGAIYTLGTQPGTVIRYNLIHDVKCAAYVGRGVYVDEGSSDMVVENNIMYDTSTGGFGMNYGRRNTIRNNIFAFGEQSQIEPIGGMAKAPQDSSYVLERNIFYWKAGHDVLRGPGQIKPGNKLEFRRNLYWQEGKGDLHFGTRSWDEWQKAGLDAGSKVADPLFVDPKKGDFRLKPGSPALEIGFEPFDLSTAGLRNVEGKIARKK